MQCPNCRKIEEAGNWRWFAGPQNEDFNEQQNNVIEVISDDEEHVNEVINTLSVPFYLFYLHLCIHLFQHNYLKQFPN